MTPELCIGIASKEGSLALATLEHGRTSAEVNFPATDMGLEAIKIFLAGCCEPVLLAVTGTAGVSLALILGNLSGRETFIVSSAVADRPIALAHYAGHVI